MRIGLSVASLICTQVVSELSLNLEKLKHKVVLLEFSNTKSVLRRQQENLQALVNARVDLIIYVSVETLKQGHAEVRAAQTSAKLYARALVSQLQQLNYKASVTESTRYEILKINKPAFDLVLNKDFSLASLGAALPLVICNAIFSVIYSI